MSMASNEASLFSRMHIASTKGGEKTHNMIDSSQTMGESTVMSEVQPQNVTGGQLDRRSRQRQAKDQE